MSRILENILTESIKSHCAQAIAYDHCGDHKEASACIRRAHLAEAFRRAILRRRAEEASNKEIAALEQATIRRFRATHLPTLENV